MKFTIKFIIASLSIFSLYAQQPSLLMQIRQANQNSYPRYGVDANGTFYFTAGQSQNSNVSVWKSDGTSGGTTEAKVASGTGPIPQYSNTKALFPFGNKVLIIGAAFSQNFDQELWVSDGSGAGTFRLADINPGTGDPFISNLKVVTLGGVTKALFSAYNPTDGTELWITDGTVAGTSMLKNINSGAASSNPFGFEQLGNSVLFFADNGINGMELWTTNGTTAGTTLLKDIRSGSGSSGFSTTSQIKTNGNYAFFGAFEGTGFGSDLSLIRTNGTTAGTFSFGQAYPNPANFTIFDTKLYFTTSLSGTGYLYYVDISGLSPVPVDYYTGGTSVLNPELLTPTATKLYLLSKFINGETRLHVIFPYSASRAVEVRDLNISATGDPFPAEASKRKLYATNNDKIYFLANDGTSGSELWMSDGDFNGTIRVVDAVTGSTGGDYSYLRLLGNQLFFVVNNAANQYDCYLTTNGAAPTPLKNLTPALNIDNVYPIASSGGNMYFSAYNATTGYELYKSNGTANTFVKDIFNSLGVNNSSNFSITATNSQGLFFVVDNGKNGLELWKSNGLVTGTSLFYDFTTYPTTENLGGYTTSYDYYNTSTRFKNLFVYNDKIYILANDALWITDGLAAPTKILSNFRISQGSFTNNFAVLNGVVYFNIVNELWKTDGTLAGTVRVGFVDAAVQGDYQSIKGLVAFNNKLYFSGNHSVYGEEIFESNGTTINLFTELSAGANAYTGLSEFMPVGSNLFFTNYNSTDGCNLYKTDGTVGNTVKLKSFGLSGGCPYYLTNFNNTQLAFQGYDAATGYELWKSDGTIGGTGIVQDIYAGNNSSSPMNLSNNNQFGVFENEIFFRASDAISTRVFRSNLTSAGTIDLGAFSNGFYIFATNGGVYFNSSASGGGPEPFKIEKESTSLRLLADLVPGTNNGSNPSNFASFSNLVFMKTNDASFREQIHVFKICKNLELQSGLVNSTLTLESLDSVKSTAIVGSTATLNLLAGKFIELNTGFQTQVSAKFQATIGGCVHNTNP